MTKPKVFEKPAGLKDYLPAAVSKLRNIEFNVLNCMERWGYQQIITPTLEYYDTVGVASSTSDNKLFKLLNKNGTTLVLRSDMTAPIARVAASLLKEEALPLRLSYHSNIFRSIEEKAGQEAEFYQTGVELIGDASPEADAEVVALAIASLKAAGVHNFKIAIGHVGFLNGLFEEFLKDREQDQMLLKECLLHRDYVGYRRLINDFSLGVPQGVTSRAPNEIQQEKPFEVLDMPFDMPLDVPFQKELEGILRLRGGQEICEQAMLVSTNPMAQQSITHLCDVWNVLMAYGVCEHVLIDLTMIGDFSYYTGMTFEGYASDLGFPLCSGGRYDNLLQQFGRPAPATGFALKTTRILEVASENTLDEPYRVLILYEAGQRAAAIQHAGELRLRNGYMVEMKRLDQDFTAEPICPAGQAYSADQDHAEIYTFDGKQYHDIIQFK